MKRWRISHGITLVMYIFAFVVILSASGKNVVSDESKAYKMPVASLYFPEANYNFGKVSQMEKLSHIFKFSNRGDKVIEIRDVKSGCGCMAVILSNSKMIPPGGTGELKVTLNTGKRRGKFEKRILIYSSDSLQPLTVLYIEATVKAEAIVEPPEVLFGDVRKDGVAIRYVQITGATGKPFKIVKVQSSSEHIAVSYPNSSEVYKHSAKISLKLKPSAPVGQLHANLFIHIKDEKLRTFEVPIYAIVEGEVELTPRRLFYGIVKKQSKEKRKLRVRFLRNCKGNIIDLKSDLPNMYLSVTTIEEGKEYSINAEMGFHRMKGKIKGYVEVYTTSAKQPKIVIPVYAYVSE